MPNIVRCPPCNMYIYQQTSLLNTAPRESCKTEAYSGSCQTSMFGLFVKVVKKKNCITDVDRAQNTESHISYTSLKLTHYYMYLLVLLFCTSVIMLCPLEILFSCNIRNYQFCFYCHLLSVILVGPRPLSEREPQFPKFLTVLF